MEPVTLKQTYGPREILPESMWTGLTRFDQSTKSWQRIVQQASAGYALSAAGIWLPTSETSDRDLEAFDSAVSQRGAADRLVVTGDQLQRVRDALGNISLSATGCWHLDDRSLFREINETNLGHTILENDSVLPGLRQCKDASCVYHRHYDITCNVPSGRRELVYPNKKYFLNTGPDHPLLTAWGDTLPSIDDSRVALDAFMRQCFPHVPLDESLLTPVGASQVSLLPHTGCWFVRSYYHTPTGQQAPKGWQYDGYGRLKIPNAIADRYNYVDFSTLAHRIVWLLHDRKLKDSRRYVLNHKCGFRPCANPGHLVQTEQQQNTVHGTAMSVSRSIMESIVERHEGVALLIAKAKEAGTDPTTITEFWSVLS